LAKTLYLSLLLALSGHLCARENLDTVFVASDNSGYIGKHLSIYCDSTASLNFDDVLRNSKFVKGSSRIPNLGITSYNYWVKISIANLSESEELFVNVIQPAIDRIEFYDPSISNSAKYSYGDTVACKDRVVKNQNFIFPVSIKKGNTKTVYLKISSGDMIQLPIEIGNSSFVQQSSSKKDTLFGLYAGIMLAMLLYNLFIFISTKEKTYILYVVYITFVFLTQTNILGYTGRFLFFDFPDLERYSVYVFSALVPIAGMLFMISFLHLKRNGKKFIPFMYIIAAVYAVALVLALNDNFQISYKILQGCASTAALYQLVIAIILTIRQVPQAKNFLVAWSAFLVGVVVFVLKDFEIVPYNELTYNMMSIGSAVESVLLSFALADRINSLKREKEMSQNRMLIALKENERMISSQNTELERRVGERTTALEQSNLELNSTLRNLKEAQKQLIEAEKLASLGQMTAGIAHELNNPINFVQSNVAPLKRDIDELTELINKVHSGSPLSHNEKLQIEFVHQEINQLLSGIEEGSKRTAEIIRGLRIFSRMDRDSIVSANINDCIQSTLIVMKSNTKGEVTIVKELQNDMPNIECFPGKLNQVLVNLITNAIHATCLPYRNQRDRVIKIRSFRSTNSVVIAIKDNGRGIEETILQKIFDPFFTTKDVGEGTGLGLSIVLGIVKEHNGHIDVQSTLGEGTEFLIYLPLIPESIRSRKAYEQ